VAEAADLAGVQRLLEIMRRLRDPVGGCPWDRAQDARSLARYTLEEACELIAAIEAGDEVALRGELGDLLFQVVFHAQLASERGQYDFDAVAQAMADKLERRHPHVFGGEAGRDASHWEQFKAEERAARGASGILDDVPVTLPALARAAKLGKRAGRVGFDWPDAAGVRDKIEEELREVAQAPVERQSEEIGDLLFAVANWSRHLSVDPEEALRLANAKFERRFRAMEQLARERSLTLKTLDAAAWDALWNEVKKREKSSETNVQ